MSLPNKTPKELNSELDLQISQSPLLMDMFRQSLALLEQQRLNDSRQLNEQMRQLQQGYEQLRQNYEQLQMHIEKIRRQDELLIEEMRQSESESITEIMNEIINAAIEQFKIAYSEERK